MSAKGLTEDRTKDLQQALASTVERISVHDSAHPLVAAAQAQGLKFAFGTIPFAGRWATGEPAVTFNSNETGSHASTWPEWAYEIAVSAIVADKRILLVYEDEPFGNNLVWVSLTTL